MNSYFVGQQYPVVTADLVVGGARCGISRVMRAREPENGVRNIGQGLRPSIEIGHELSITVPTAFSGCLVPGDHVLILRPKRRVESRIRRPTQFEFEPLLVDVYSLGEREQKRVRRRYTIPDVKDPAPILGRGWGRPDFDRHVCKSIESPSWETDVIRGS